MAFSGGAVSADQIETVMMVTSFQDRAMITNALQSNHGNVETVINEYLDDAAKFRRRYGWDESAFSMGREGEDAPGNHPNVPSFTVHPPVIYGTEPTSFFDAPSRPPSRANNNRSPLSNLADVAAAKLTTNAPSNRQEEEDQLQRAINESLNTSGVQSPHAFPPPPPPVPQQSGVTTNNMESSVHFGPANRPDYAPDEWAMVRLAKQESDSDPSLRSRGPGKPVLLRCRQENPWMRHRIGALLMMFQHIPAARNALLQTGEIPGYGYGNKSDWWQGEPILPPGTNPHEPIDDSTLSWTDELHRLMGFLESTERAYGTADILSKARHLETRETGDLEKDFFQSFSMPTPEEGTRDNRGTLMSCVELVTLDNFAPQGGDCFGLLDLQVSKDVAPSPESLYNCLDWLFFVDLRLAREDMSAARMAWITQASEVFTCRIQGDEGLPMPIEIPEVLYLDRYMKVNGEKTKELQLDMIGLLNAYDANVRKEEELIKWVNPQTNKVYDRRVLIKAGISRCQDHIRRIKHAAFWRQHEQASPDGEGEYYLPEHAGEPSLLPAEVAVVAHYESKILELEGQQAEIERMLNAGILAKRDAIHAVNRKMTSLLTVPSTDEKWNPTHKYTLRGVANDANTVYLRIRGLAADSESISAEDTPAPTEESWCAVSFREEDNTVEHTAVSYETVMREACGAGCAPILVFATDKAMEEGNMPVSDTLKAFVKLDNRLFKQELLQSNRSGHKRGSGPENGSQSKRLQRSASVDSMDTNHASVGDFEDLMRDAAFDDDPAFGGGGGGAAPQGTAAPQDDDIPDLVELPAQPRQTSPAPPTYSKVLELESGMSPALAQVSLQDAMSSNSPPGRPQEMQQRPNAQFLTRPATAAGNNGSVANIGTTNGAANDGATVSEDGSLFSIDSNVSDYMEKVNGV